MLGTKALRLVGSFAVHTQRTKLSPDGKWALVIDSNDEGALGGSTDVYLEPAGSKARTYTLHEADWLNNWAVRWLDQRTIMLDGQLKMPFVAESVDTGSGPRAAPERTRQGTCTMPSASGRARGHAQRPLLRRTQRFRCDPPDAPRSWPGRASSGVASRSRYDLARACSTAASSRSTLATSCRTPGSPRPAASSRLHSARGSRCGGTLTVTLAHHPRAPSPPPHRARVGARCRSADQRRGRRARWRSLAPLPDPEGPAQLTARARQALHADTAMGLAPADA